mmetsp:Transcript_18677/g.50149  ORF Transcript_18677/g.50149 Transcript_18677/m.50149 type:complete len:220 (-) Transcript_18677:3605-4264(-)
MRLGIRKVASHEQLHGVCGVVRLLEARLEQGVLSLELLQQLLHTVLHVLKPHPHVLRNFQGTFGVSNHTSVHVAEYRSQVAHQGRGFLVRTFLQLLRWLQSLGCAEEENLEGKVTKILVWSLGVLDGTQLIQSLEVKAVSLAAGRAAIQVVSKAEDDRQDAQQVLGKKSFFGLKELAENLRIARSSLLVGTDEHPTIHSCLESRHSAHIPHVLLRGGKG